MQGLTPGEREQKCLRLLNLNQFLGKFRKTLMELKKSLALEVRQKKDISERRSKTKPPSTLTVFVPRPLGRCVTSKESSYTKNENNLF